MRSINHIVITICLLTLVSCIKEDMSECPTTLLVQFTSDPEYNNWEAEELHKVTVFIFDENGNYLTSWSPETPELDKIYTPEVDLLTGKYNFVVWSNVYSLYSITHLDDDTRTRAAKEQALLEMNIPTTRDINLETTRIPLMLYGHVDGELKPVRENLVTIPLVQNNNTVNVTVAGLERTNDSYHISITDNNGIYRFDNSIAPCGDFSYRRRVAFTAASNELSTSLSVLKLDAGHRTPLLTVVNEVTRDTIFPSAEWTNNRLIDLILAAHPTNDFTKNHVYDIRINFEDGQDGSIVIQVTVNGWTLITEPDSNLTP
ncbi:MAG: FimB/Mfa2 family fimbrial subunit [Bacteroidales bacterium]|jgi:hypothetical protein|nr:FimB/Mfa2 family fimbrial subunit [Bacteroidales bacterium]